MTQILWTQKQDIGPAARSRFDMVYDTIHHHIVLFGGYTGSGRLNDTWEWDGEEWTQTADIGPSPRSGHALAYDSERQRIVLFGGTTGVADLNDTWEWDGENWTQVADTGPVARSGHGTTFDSKRKRVLLFGGNRSGTAVAYGDTWNWDGNEWTQEQDTGPGLRLDHRLVYDTIRDRVALFGGSSVSSYQVQSGNWLTGYSYTTYYNYTALGDTWEYDGLLWSHVADTGPQARSAHGMIYDGEKTILFGGVAGNQYFGNTWSWDGKYWTQRQDMGPGARGWFGMAYDGDRARAVLFGGATQISVFADTWEQFERTISSGPQ
jgi:hypothetical protein